MPDDRPYTPAELAAVERAMQDAFDAGTPGEQAEAVLDAAAPLIAARIRRQVAAEIAAHADRHAGHPLTHPRTTLRRHLLTAARVAEGPLTDDDLAQIAAQVVGLAHATTGEDHDDH